jgi:SAM-dependent methyltransferase
MSAHPYRHSHADFVHRLPRARVVDRTAYLCELVRDKRVIHLGFVDEGRMAAKQAQDAWLHEPIARAAASVVGIDLDEAGVARARELGFDAHVADCQSAESLQALGLEPADVVLAGEIIEHLDAPGAFAEAVKTLVAPDGLLVVTTPNGFALTNFVAALLFRELVHVDHVSWYSWRTLASLLLRHGWRPEHFAYYAAPRIRSATGFSRADRAKVAAFRGFKTGVRPVVTLFPPLADGLIAVARPPAAAAPPAA